MSQQINERGRDTKGVNISGKYCNAVISIEGRNLIIATINEVITNEKSH